MRELKFRAWNKEDEVYLHITKNKEDGVVGISPDGKKVLYLEDGEVIILEDVIIEPSTGLKDKNGKEIYVGDIVSEHNGDIIGEIIQKPSGEYCIAWIGVYSGSSVLYDELSMCAVIGYIH